MTDTTAPRRVKRGWMNLLVTDVIEETHDTKTFILEDKDDGGIGFDYIAGQYLTFRFDDVGPKPLVRSYTMSSSPRQANMCAVTIKRVDHGVISNWCCDKVETGMILRARGPIGKFCYDSRTDAPHLFMVAGGSGVTPFVSIMREYCDKLGTPGAPQKMTLLVSFRTPEDLICWRDLQGVTPIEGCRVITTLSRSSDPQFWHGRIDEPMLARAIDGDYDNTTFMTCGPKAIMDLTVGHLRAKGVAEPHIKQESFES